MTNTTRKIIFFLSLIVFLSGCASSGSVDSSLSSEEIKKIIALSEHESKNADNAEPNALPETLTLKKMDTAITPEQTFVIKTFIQLHHQQAGQQQAGQQQLFSLAQISVPVDNTDYAVMGTMLANARVIREQLKGSHISSDIMIDPTAIKGQIVLTLLRGDHHAK